MFPIENFPVTRYTVASSTVYFPEIIAKYHLPHPFPSFPMQTNTPVQHP